MNVFVEDGDRVRRKRNNRKARPPVVTPTDTAAPTADASSEMKKDALPQPVLMVEVENVVHDKFRQTEEVKVIYFYIFLFSIV